jgi:hypothetical protein
MASKQVEFHEAASLEFEAAFAWYFERSLHFQIERVIQRGMIKRVAFAPIESHRRSVTKTAFPWFLQGSYSSLSLSFSCVERAKAM